MTKEELEKLRSTVKEWLFHTGSLNPNNYADELCKDFIEPREKRIAELEEKLAISEHDREHNDYELTEVYKKIAELEVQIEKMQCCENCAFFKDKKYQICHDIKKQGSKKCAFYKMI